jgi:hypothetical protein
MAAALWWGSLSGLAFVVVPLLFRRLGSPAEAGALAAQLFSAQTWVTASSCILLLLLVNRPDDAAMAGQARAVSGLAIAGLLLALLVEFGVAQKIVSARSDGGNLRLWHGVGSAMYFAQWVCAGLAVWRLSRRDLQLVAPA